jgi:hypothetical protein
MNKTSSRVIRIAVPVLATAALGALVFALAPGAQAAPVQPAARAADATPESKRAPASIAGTITLTVRGDDAAFTPIPNLAVVISDLTTGVSLTGTTNANGDVVMWLAAGNYKACEILPDGYVNVYPGNSCYWITLTDIGEASLLFKNAAVSLPGASASGGAAVTVDLMDDDNIPQPGWTITAKESNSGVERSEQTNQRGVAQFSLPSGNYQICETVQELYLVGYPGSPCYWVTLANTDTLSLHFTNTHLRAVNGAMPAP